jgi:hypothetical protein
MYTAKICIIETGDKNKIQAMYMESLLRTSQKNTKRDRITAMN